MSASDLERMIVVGSRYLLDHRVVFAGVGAPLVASVLAQELHAPHLTIILEGGFVGPRMLPGKLPISTNEMRAARGAVMHTGITDVFLYAQRGYFDYGFLGAAQVDPYGNVNASIIGTAERPKVRMSGTGGANDIASSCREVFIITKHERRRFVETVDFVTSPGHLSGGQARERAGLPEGGPSKVITDLAILGFDPRSKRMTLESLQPGVSVDQVQESTGFDLLVADEVGHVVEPTEQELRMLRYLESGESDEVLAQKVEGVSGP